MRRLLIVPIVLFLLAAPLVGDQVYLKTGKRLEGKVIAEHPDRIELKLGSGEVKTIPRDDIAMIQKGSSKNEEYKQRLKDVKDDDLDGLLELAAWCQDENMRRQQISVLRKAIKLDPDCPEAQRALLMKWSGSRWVKDGMKGQVDPARGASESTHEKIGLKLTPPNDWTVKDSGADGLVLSAPDRYRQPVTLEIKLATEAPAVAFKADGWSEPKSVTFGQLNGFVAERKHKDGSRRLKSRAYAMTGNGWQLRFTYSALEAEFDDWTDHVELVMRSLVVLEPKLDFKHPGIGVGFCYPQDGNWECMIYQNQEKEFLFLVLRHKGEGPLGYAVIQYNQVDLKPEVSGDLEKALDGAFSPADVKAKRDSSLGTAPARVWEAETLQQGIPVFSAALVAARGTKGHFLRFSCHERTVEKYRPIFEQVCKSFVFDVK